MNTGMPDLSRRAIAVFRWLLRFYPTAFRREYEEKLILLFQDQLRDAKVRREAWAMARFWARILLDTGRAAGREHWSELSRAVDAGMSATLLHYAPSTWPRRAWLMFSCAFLVSFAIWWTTPPIYSGTARVMLRNQNGSFDPYDSYESTTAIERIASQSTLDAVARSRRLSGEAGKMGPVLRRNLRVKPYRNTSVVEISYTTADPEQAAAIANEIAVAFIDQSRERNRPMVELVDPAVTPIRPIGPNPIASLVLAVIGGLAGACALELVHAVARHSAKSLRTV